MYTEFYGLREKPFSLSPDPRFLFLAQPHREALAHLLYGIDQGEGFIAVTGEVGMGKTTLCRTLLQRLGPDVEVAFLFNPSQSGMDLLRAINAELGLDVGGRTRADLHDQLNKFLLEMKRTGRRVLLIVDEAQNLPKPTLEEVRLLSNLETSTEKLIQILLFGQPELDILLDSDELRQLRQRISVRWSLKPLSAPETRDYVRHRLRIAAGGDCNVLSERALREIHKRSRGIPRLVNVLADRTLLGGFAAGEKQVGPDRVAEAAREIISGSPASARSRRWRRPLAAALGVTLAAAVAAAGVFYWQRRPQSALPEFTMPPVSADAPDRIAPPRNLDPLAGAREEAAEPADEAAPPVEEAG